ncbi:RNA-binding protein [Pedobacter aquatilis]|uniref:RNA recognition motif domain-containing protein n=1 Tax=Pedobacter aquatilis TaxID=351343 RepID=UPI00292D6069|nr:RNA-binding protein [Pedobacter aquatilis]
MTKLFIGGLADNIQEMDLAILVSLHGEIDTIKVVRDRATGRCKGYAFLEIPKLTDANNIISMLNGESFKGNTLTIKISEDIPVKKPSQRPNKFISRKIPR